MNTEPKTPHIFIHSNLSTYDFTAELYDQDNDIRVWSTHPSSQQAEDDAVAAWRAELARRRGRMAEACEEAAANKVRLFPLVSMVN